MTPDIDSIGEFLQLEGAEEMPVESTGIYWIAI